MYYFAYGSNLCHRQMKNSRCNGCRYIKNAYLDNYEEVPSFLLDDYDEVGGIEGLSGNSGYSSEFYGIVNLCGAVGDQEWIIEGDIPVVSMHGDQDDVVPYDDNF